MQELLKSWRTLFDRDRRIVRYLNVCGMDDLECYAGQLANGV